MTVETNPAVVQIVVPQGGVKPKYKYIKKNNKKKGGGAGGAVKDTQNEEQQKARQVLSLF